MRSTSNLKTFATVADVTACREMLRGGSRTFFAASLVLPKSVRAPATGLYAFCRMADDAIDCNPDDPAAVSDLDRRLDAIYAGAPRNVAADRAFADAVSQFSIPRAYPQAMLEGFAWDAAGRTYESLSDLNAYAVRVAGTVGAMMAMVMGVRDQARLARACDLGVAMQFTNIARDVGEDARAGRLYLPRAWLREAGVAPEQWLARPTFTPPLGRVIEQLLAEADVLYRRSEFGLARLPTPCRPGMYAARLLYAEIGHEVARRGFDSVSARATVSWQRKARRLAEAMRLAGDGWQRVGSNDVLEEARFLLADMPASNEVTAPLPAETARERARWPRLEDRVIWLVDLFERLERHERSA